MGKHNLRGVGGRFIKGPTGLWAQVEREEYQARCQPIRENAAFYGRPMDMSWDYLWIRLITLATILLVVAGSCH